MGGQISSIMCTLLLYNCLIAFRMGASDKIHAGKSTFMVELLVCTQSCVICLCFVVAV